MTYDEEERILKEIRRNTEKIIHDQDIIKGTLGIILIMVLMIAAKVF